MRRSVCNNNYVSQFAYIAEEVGTVSDSQVNIKDYLKNIPMMEKVNNKTKVLVCQKGHELEVEPEKLSHFIHKHKEDTGGNMSEWHAYWQGLFRHECREVYHKEMLGSHTNRKADILIYNNVLEIQHSNIQKQEVENRNHDYTLHNREVHWIIDSNNSIKVTKLEESNTYMIKFIKDYYWQYEHFISCKYIYLNKGEQIYRIEPSKVRSHMIDVRECKTKEEFIQSYKDQSDIWDDSELPQCKLYHNQRGAGCGKTYESIQLLSNDERFKHKTTFIYLTKAHSAKEVINNEFKEQYQAGKLENLNVAEGNSRYGRQYRIKYSNTKYNSTCDIVIGTIDSFINALGDKTNRHSNYFIGLLDSIKKGFISTLKDGGVDYAKERFLLNKNCLVIIDECQDLDKEYIESIAQIMRNTYIDVYIIGDKLQSIYKESNIYTFLENNELPNTIIEKNIPEGNCVRRFHNIQFIDFVNKVIDFEKYNLPAVTSVCDGNCGYTHENNKTPYTIFEQETIYSSETDNNKINQLIDRIIQYMEDEIEKNKYVPRNFMFIFPILYKNPLANMLESKLQNFWIKKFDSVEYQNDVLKNDKYWKDNIDDYRYDNHSYLHKAEEGKGPIDITVSEQSTRLMTIHASKGLGCEVVFLLNVTESALQKCSKDTGNLVYDSLLHVAITRQKKSIYVGIQKNDDDIYQRFSSYHDVNVRNIEPSLWSINKYTMINKITEYALQTKFTEFDELYIKPRNLFNLIPKDDINKDKEIIDWGHHIIRYCVLRYSFMFNVINNEKLNCDRSQIFANLKVIKELPREILREKEYNEALVTISKNKNEKINKPVEYIPILLFDAKENSKYREYSILLKKIIKRIQIKLKRDYEKGTIPNFCPLEMTILVHIIDVICNGKYVEITIKSIYDLIYIYDKCSNIINDENHKGFQCLCQKSFKSSEICEANEDIKNSIINHYRIVQKVKNIYSKFTDYIREVVQDKGKYTFNINPSLWYEGSKKEFSVFNKSLTCIAHSDKYVINFVLKPSFNKLNFNEVIIDTIFNDFLIRFSNSSIEKPKQYHNKKVISCIFTFSAEDPIFIQHTVEDTSLIESCIQDFLVDKYEKCNNKVIDLYTHCVQNKPKNKNSIEFMVHKLKNYKKLPEYINKYFNNINDKIDDEKLSREDKVKIVNAVNIECLNESLFKSVRRNMKREEEDCDF